jgi:hypothetical protein
MGHVLQDDSTATESADEHAVVDQESVETDDMEVRPAAISGTQ